VRERDVLRSHFTELEVTMNSIPKTVCLCFLLPLSTHVSSQTQTATQPLYGFTAFPYDLSLEAIDKVHEIILPNSNLYAIHRDDGCVPWAEALSGAPFPDWLTKDWADIKARVPAEMPISLHLTPTQQDRRTMAYQCGDAEGEVGIMPAALEDKIYNDPQIMTAYLNYARRIADIFEPTFLTVGIEMSELSLRHPDEWEPFAELMDATLEGLKASRTRLKIGAEFVLQSLLLPRVAAQVKPLIERLDFLGISFYPYGGEFGELYGAPALPPPPAQWREPLEWLRGYTNKPIAIVEAGYTTKDREVFGVRFPGNEELQEAFLNDLLAFAKEDNYFFVVWFVPVDYEKLLRKLPETTNTQAAHIWVNAGLFDSNLNPKGAWELWQKSVTDEERNSDTLDK
jgi:hypothetical protein